MLSNDQNERYIAALEQYQFHEFAECSINEMSALMSVAASNIIIPVFFGSERILKLLSPARRKTKRLKDKKNKLLLSNFFYKVAIFFAAAKTLI